VSEKAKLIRGDPPKIDFKKKGEPPKNHGMGQKCTVHCAVDLNSPSRKTVGCGTVRQGHGRRINSEPLLYFIEVIF